MTTPAAAATPATEAGRALLERVGDWYGWDRVTAEILAIEAEALAARDAEVTRLRTALGRVTTDYPWDHNGVCRWCDGMLTVNHPDGYHDDDCPWVDARAALAPAPEASDE